MCYRLKQQVIRQEESNCKACPVSSSSPVCGSDGHNYASQVFHTTFNFLPLYSNKLNCREIDHIDMINFSSSAYFNTIGFVAVFFDCSDFSLIRFLLSGLR